VPQKKCTIVAKDLMLQIQNFAMNRRVNRLR